MSDAREHPTQQLQGYTLLDRLGSGGYGEVWRAQAPGGLAKAVKYVFGRQDEARASSELHALERIKEVRHPFLLSLERIEVVDGRLIVVTELADGSLRDRFNACVAAGEPGIPRDELLGYIRDAADALDFLNGVHDLQHLDIKPENLLLLAGHVKVADFGLVKSISNQAQSLIGGMTPAYAAPEVFQGRPSKRSDQYSLAILYQELLTSSLPFYGANAAELTLQHMNDEPDLSRLSEHDRYALSRALSKDPEYRYDSCSDMVRALAASDETTASTSVASPRAERRPLRPSSEGTVAHSATEVFDGDDPGWSAPDAPILIDVPALPEDRPQMVPMPEVDTEHFEPSPALFIGIGGTAGQTLRTLRQRIGEQFDDVETPSLPMLLLDTDAKSLMAATRGGDRGEGLAKDETIHLPLKRPQDYRDKSTQLLQWLGRRWLYNIPRSLQTDGIRPLGRLALIDHARRAFQRIRRSMAECVTEESLATSHEQTGLPFRKDCLRVYVCASISGGAGGGMSLDVAYAVRSILQRLSFADAKVIGVMMHSTGRDTQRGELARVNAYSWLSEYEHLCQPEVAYPGDEGCGLPAHPAGVKPFDETYLVDLGRGLDTAALESAARSVADYLLLDALTPAQSLLDASRSTSGSESAAQSIRSFGVVRRTAGLPESLQGAEQLVIERLLDSWTGEAASRGISQNNQSRSTVVTGSIMHDAAQLVSSLKLSAAGLTSLSQSIHQARFDARFSANDLAVPSDAAGDGLTWAKVQRDVDQAMGGSGHERQTDQPNELIEPLANKLQSSLRAWILGRLNIPGERVVGMRDAAAWFADHLRSIERELQQSRDQSQQQTAEWQGQLSEIDWATADADVFAGTQKQLIAKRIEAAANESATSIVGHLLAAVSQLATTASEAGRVIESLKPQSSSVTSAAREAVFAELSRHLPNILADLDGRIERELLASVGGLGKTIQHAEELSQLREALPRLAQQSISAVCEECVATSFAGADPATQNQFEDQQRSQDAMPSLAKYAACVQSLDVQPPASLASERREESSRVSFAGLKGDAFHIVEAQGIPVARVAVEAVGRRQDYATLGERVHTRKDIAWGDLLLSLHADAETKEPTGAAAIVESPEVIATQVLPT